MVLFKSRGLAGLKEETKAQIRSGLLAMRAKGSWLEVDEEEVLSIKTEVDGLDARKAEEDLEAVGSLDQVRAWTASR
jgi:hypothetical protein